MGRTNRKLLIAAAFVLVGSGLYASPLFFSSPQKQATATEIWSDADLFLSTRGYAGVDFDKFFSFISFQNRDLSFSGETGMMQLGFATRFGDLYTALYYGGNTLALPLNTYTEKDGKRYYGSAPPLFRRSGTTEKVPHNEGALLIGVADMGFRLAFASEYNSNNLKDIVVGTQQFNSYQEEYGHLNPQIAWGMTKELIPDMGLKPHVYVDLDFMRDYKKTDEINFGDAVDHSNNDFTLGITAVTGSLALVKINNFEFGVDLWYTLNLKLFNNEYSAPDGTVVPYKANTKGYNESGKWVDLGYYRTDYAENYLTPYLYASWSGDRIELSGELELELGVTSEKGSEFIEGPSALIKDGASFKSTTFAFTPTFYLGMQYAIVREKLFLNVGSKIKILSLSSEGKSIDTYNNDNQVGDTKNEYTNNFTGASTELKVGLTYNITRNVGFQAMCGVGINTNNMASMFGTGNTVGNTDGLAVFSQLMATVKF